MLHNIAELPKKYPAQFWLMFLGMLISTLGASMIWPFLMIYVSERLELPLAVVASLLTINAISIIITSFIAGPVVDRMGRKWVMLVSLALNGLLYALYIRADTYLAFAFLMVFSGMVTPLYRIGSDAMLADLVPPEQRVDAYALLRLSNNLGISLGPTIGGFLAASSYTSVFYLAGSGMLIYSLLLLFLARETLPKNLAHTGASLPQSEPLGGYLAILRDAHYMRFILTFTLVQACAVLIWTILPVHAKLDFGISERQYGFIPTTNAVMVVVLQVLITSVTKNFAILPVLAVGSVLYAVSNGVIAFSSTFAGFWLGMVIMTVGEMILMPTSSTYVANLAPPDKRGRYMSLYGLTWGAASGAAPIMGGLLSDIFSPQAAWLGGFSIGLLAALFFLWMGLSQHPPTALRSHA